MRTGIILSSIWLGSVLALASVQAASPAQAAPAAEQAPAAGEEAPAAADTSDEEKPATTTEKPAATAEKPAEAAPAAPAATTTEKPAEATPAAPAATTEEPAEPAPAAPAAAGRPAGAPSAPAGKVSAITRPMPPLTQYQVLSERNIFSRVRGPRAMRPRTGPMVRPPERYLILKGTLGGEKGYVAFIEDTRTSETQVRQAGDVVGQGRITAVGLDGLTYEQNGTVTKVAIGEYVGGAPPAGSAPVAAAAPAAGPAATSPGGATDVAEMMRQRRLKEEGK